MIDLRPSLRGLAVATAFALGLVLGCQGGPAAPSAAQPPAPAPEPPPAPAPLFERTYETGAVRFVNRRELPNEFFTVRGAMTVRFYEGYVVVDRDAGALVFPREYLVFANSSDFE